MLQNRSAVRGGAVASYAASKAVLPRIPRRRRMFTTNLRRRQLSVADCVVQKATDRKQGGMDSMGLISAMGWHPLL